MLRDALVCFCLATLCLIRVVTQLVYAAKSQYFAASPYRAFEYASACLNIICLAVLFLLVSFLARKANLRLLHNACQLGFVLAFAPIADFVRRDLNIGYGTLLHFGMVPFLISVAVVAGLLFYVRSKLVRILYRALLILSPAALLVFGELIIKAASAETVRVPPVKSESFKRPAHIPAGRVVWIIFDEWDQSTVFEHRPPGLALPVLDSIASTSFVATNAYPPAGNTLESIPAYLTGHVFRTVTPAGYHRLEVGQAAGGREVDFRNLPNIFTELEGKGYDVAAAGWYHPYDAFVTPGANASVCWRPIPLYQGFRGTTIASSMGRQLLFVFAPILIQHAAVSAFEAIHAFACAAVSNPSVDFVYLHYSVPHLPGVFDPTTGKIALRFENQTKSYLDNLPLCDRVLADILGRLAAAKLDEKTTIILTSDHWWREAPDRPKASDRRVPLVIRMPDGGKPVIMRTPMNTIVIKDIVKQIIEGDMRNYDDLSRWLAASGGRR